MTSTRYMCVVSKRDFCFYYYWPAKINGSSNIYIRVKGCEAFNATWPGFSSPKQMPY